MVLLDGALVNQMIQYIFARCLEEKYAAEGSAEKVVLDDSWFHTRHDQFMVETSKGEHHEYQLGKFPRLKHVTLMSEYCGPGLWGELMAEANRLPPLRGGSHLPQLLKDRGWNFFMIAEPPVYRFDGMVAHMPYYHYIPQMLEARGNVYYYGYFAHTGWFASHADMFRRELELPPLWEARDLEMLERIRESYAISVHIRRGGYAASGRATPGDYFRRALRSACEQAPGLAGGRTPRVFVFSDEIGYVRGHAADYGLDRVPFELVYSAEDRDHTDNHCDLQLMSHCDFMILELNSTYSWMAAMLNTTPGLRAIDPNPQRGLVAR